MPSPSEPDVRPYFDSRWYAATYGPAKRRIRWQPWRYYRRHGWRKGHAPCVLFDAAWYLAANPDVQSRGLEPLAHYVRHGWREGRQPHPLFDPSWYADQYPDVASSGVEPLLHYVTGGWREGRQPHPAFDSAGYLAANPDVAAAGLDPLAHYLRYGWRERRRPNPLFDVGWYLDRNPDVAAAGLEPLSHFLTCGWQEGRAAAPGLSWNYDTAAPARGPMAGLSATSIAGPVNRGQVRTIAMYRPQSHPFPETDACRGEGLTEWSDVRQARPMFTGHQQPHVPHPGVGYDDPADGSVLERQAELARRHGIHGFCFYHSGFESGFEGHRSLQRLLEQFLASGRPDFPFCLCWDNENGTRAGDGLDREVLSTQRHPAESDERFLRGLLPALRDRRYITVSGLPLLAVYRPGLLADPGATADRWRRIAEREGLPGLHLAAVHASDQADPRNYGFDAAIQLPPLQAPASNLRQTGLAGLDRRFGGSVLDYREAVCHALATPQPGYPLYRGVMPGWDDTPRRMEQATVWVNSSPMLYGRWLRGVIEQIQREQPPERQLVFVNAWNDWVNGAHLEPDVRHGHAFLEQTAAALLPPATGQRAAVSGIARIGGVVGLSELGDGRPSVTDGVAGNFGHRAA